MQRFLLVIIGVVMLLALIPVIVVKLAPSPENMPPSKETQTVSLYLHETDEVIEVPLYDYLIGVVAAEMPAAFEEEALKAQAIAARTYFKYHLNQSKRAAGHPEGAHICNWPEHGQAWISDKEMKSRWGELTYPIYRRKIQEAVYETQGKIISYRGELINPLYHASCGGLGTEASSDVWGGGLPYLVNRPCPNNQDPKPKRQYEFTWEELREALKLSEAVPVAALKGAKAIEVKEYSQGGRIKELNIGGVKLKGSEFRSKLGLASTSFTWKRVKDGIEITTVGYGHGVGMCQRGAQGLALNNYSHEEILKHYYLGVEVETKH